jgi:anti-sigma factor RsiW
VPETSPIEHCSECVKLLGDYVDGLLAPDQSEALERHLSLCMPCITFLRTYRATGHLCRKKLAREMPGELKNGLASFLASRVPGYGVSAPAETKQAAPAGEPSLAAAPAKKAT